MRSKEKSANVKLLPTLERVRPLNKKAKGQQSKIVISKFTKGKIALAQG